MSLMGPEGSDLFLLCAGLFSHRPHWEVKSGLGITYKSHILQWSIVTVYTEHFVIVLLNLLHMYYSVAVARSLRR